MQNFDKGISLLVTPLSSAFLKINVDKKHTVSSVQGSHCDGNVIVQLILCIMEVSAHVLGIFVDISHSTCLTGMNSALSTSLTGINSSVSKCADCCTHCVHPCAVMKFFPSVQNLSAVSSLHQRLAVLESVRQARMKRLRERRSHTPVTSHTCLQCKAAYRNCDALIMHRIRHIEGKHWPCPVRAPPSLPVLLP